MSDEIFKTLNLVPIKEEEERQSTQLQKYEPPPTTPRAVEDYDEVQANIRDAVAVATKALAEMAEIASSSQHPKAYESLNSLITTAINANEKLLDIQLKKKKIEEANGIKDDVPPTNVQNNLFVGTTAEFLKMIERKKEKK